jgi:hypothetical protein
LLDEFKRQLAGSQAPYLEGTCFTYGESISYLPFLDVVRACCGLTDAGTDAVVHERIAARLASLALEPSTMAPYLENLLCLNVEDPSFSRLTPDLIRQRTVAAITRLVVAEARGHPFVLILEDVQTIPVEGPHGLADPLAVRRSPRAKERAVDGLLREHVFERILALWARGQWDR